MMQPKIKAMVIILLSILLCLFVTTLFAIGMQSSKLLFGLYYEQLVGILIGLIGGVLVSAFVLKTPSLEKIRHETFSFIALGVALFVFIFNSILPRYFPDHMLGFTLSTGEIILPSVTSALTFSFIISIFLAAIILALVLKINDNEE